MAKAKLPHEDLVQQVRRELRMQGRWRTQFTDKIDQAVVRCSANYHIRAALED